MKTLFRCVLLAVLLSVQCVQTCAAGSAASNPKKAAAMKPNLDLSTYRRCYTTGETVTVNLQAFNVRSVEMRAYAIDLNKIVRSSALMDDFSRTENSIDLSGVRAAASWRVPTGKIYVDQWAQLGTRMPKLAPGVYLVAARANGVEKRTWIAITDAALLVKRSRQELLAYAANVLSGKPIAGVSLKITDRNGASNTFETGSDGTVRVPETAKGNVWINGVSSQGPVFDLCGETQAADPYTIYTVTDRPIYRPGNLVQFKATVRRRVEAAGPGGFRYETWANSAVKVEFRDSTDALIESRPMTTNSYGSINGSFALASECGQGSWHINVLIGGYTSYTQFDVQSYRKPEMTATFTFDKPHYLCGSVAHALLNVQYFFGRPVANATVKYSISYNGGDGSYDAKGTTDSQGHLALNIQTKRLPTDQDLSISATITDLSRRSITANADTTIAAGMFQLSMTTDQNVYKPGQRITITVSAADYDQKPVPAKAQVSMVETKQDDQHRLYRETTTRDVTIGRDGTGTVAFSSPRPGELQFTATAFDDQKDKITADADVTISDQEPQEPVSTVPALVVTADKTHYNPGETAVLQIATTMVDSKAVAATMTTPAQPAHGDAWALVTMEGERLGLEQVIHLTKRHSILRIPLTDADFPSVELHVEIIQDHEITDQDITLPVVRDEQNLTVTVTPDKSSYQPGQSATYTVTTTNAQGKPVAAEVSVGVVDASIYDVEPDSAPVMSDFFYPSQTVRIQTDFSFAAQYSGGGYQTMPGVPSPAREAAVMDAPYAKTDSAVRVRNTFADTAYWGPTVTTGADGTATVQLILPDNLTTWRATAHAITLGTAVGSTTNDVVSVMPLLVRLEVPRFLVQGDQSVLSAIVQNGTSTARTVHVSATVKGGTIAGNVDTTIQLAAGEQQRLDWTVTASGPDAAVLDVTADGGPGGQDAAESALPVSASGYTMVTAGSTVLTAASATDLIDLTSLPAGASIELTLSSSLAGSISRAVQELLDRPDGNAECAASALAANVAAWEADQSTGKNGGVSKATVEQDVSLSLQKLYLYQHPDGGWNWWEFDQTDGDITAAVVDALLEAKDAGFTVDDQRLLRGIAALQKLAIPEEDPSSQASWLMTLARAGSPAAAMPLEALARDPSPLDNYGLASLALGLLKDGVPGDRIRADHILRLLIENGSVQGRTVSWPARAGQCPWSDDDVVVTAHVLRALLEGTPESSEISGAVQWLMANRSGDGWDSSAADREAVTSLSLYLRQTDDLHSSFRATVALDGQSIGAVNSYSGPNASVITLSAEQLQGHKSVTITKQGTGTLYVGKVISSVLPADQAKPSGSGIGVSRQFLIAMDDPSKAQYLASGTPIQVQLDINADTNYRYVRLEDLIPAGCEVSEGDDLTGGSGYPIDFSDGDIVYTQEDVRDNRVVFSFDNLPKGHTHLTYSIMTEQPGTYAILPSTAALTYFPEVRGNTGMAHVVITDQP